MNIDDTGHKFGLDSMQYRNKARVADGILSHYLDNWLAEGYQVIVTADHGMNNDRSHGGILDEERQVPMFVFGSAFSMADAEPLQTELCGTVCQLLNISHDKPHCADLLV